MNEPVRILVCDDEPLVRAVIEAALEAGGYAPTSVSSAEEALEAFASTRFDAAIVDRRLGAADGLELLARLRELRADLPLVLASGVHERPSELARLAGPPVALLHKPFRPSALRALVREQLGEPS